MVYFSYSVAYVIVFPFWDKNLTFRKSVFSDMKPRNVRVSVVKSENPYKSVEDRKESGNWMVGRALRKERHGMRLRNLNWSSFVNQMSKDRGFQDEEARWRSALFIIVTRRAVLISLRTQSTNPNYLYCFEVIYDLLSLYEPKHENAFICSLVVSMSVETDHVISQSAEISQATG